MTANKALTDANSNGDTAKTVEETVMAAQVGDNVVNDSVPASASAPAGVAANPITTDSADTGKPTNDATQNDGTIEHTADTGSSEPTVIDGVAAASSTETASRGEGQTEDAGSSIPAETEGSKAEVNGTEQKKEEGHHVRTNSVKKPTTFSRVSATKNFMTKAASPTPTAAATPKASEKPNPLAAPAQPAAAKPRLIAKSASTLQNIQGPRPGAKAAGAPDASTVWNKNRRMPTSESSL